MPTYLYLNLKRYGYMLVLFKNKAGLGGSKNRNLEGLRMLKRRLLFVILCFMPFQVWSVYDAEAIKADVIKQELFQVSAWQQTNNVWQAVTSLRGTELSVSEQKTEYVLPFINPQQKKTAEIQCTALAMLGLVPRDDAERSVIKNAITASIRRHVLKYADLNGVRFTITARQVGPIVQLFCDLRSKHNEIRSREID